MAEALYRKYRPNTFAEVAEQGHVVRTVVNQLKDGKVAHAYLFAGPRGVGKTTIARLLAKALNCENRKPGDGEPCNTCSSCLEMKTGRMIDVVEIDAASQTKVEETRENIIENVRFSPTKGKFKVFIIDEVHMLSTASFNALLKTLEEPPAHAVFILATTELHKIPATIISRCQRFDFHRVPPKEMIERLTKISAAEGFSVAENVLATIARLSEGCLRDAESLLGQLFSLDEKNITEKEASLILPATHLDLVIALSEAIVRRDVREALALIERFVDEGGSVKHFTDELLAYVRSMLFASLGSVPEDSYDPASLTKLKALAGESTPQELRKLLDLLLSARSRHTLGAYPALPLELAVVEACLPPESTIEQIAPVAPAPQPVKPAPKKPEVKSPAPSFVSSQDLPPSLIDDTPVEVIAEQPSTSAPSSGAPLTFTLVDFQDKWGRCCSLVAEKNVALPLVLKNAKPTAIEGSRVVITFEYEFHVNTMKETKNLRLLSDAIGVVMMETPSEIELVVAKKAEAENTLDTLVEAFGGEVL